MGRTDIVNILTSIYNFFKPKVIFPIFVSSTTTGTIASGTSKVAIRNSGAASGTVTANSLAYTLESQEIITLDPGFTRKNDKITFDATGTTFKIIYYL